MDRCIDVCFRGLLLVLQFLRDRREFVAHAKVAPDVCAYGATHRLIRSSRPESWRDYTLEEAEYHAELAAAKIYRVTGENPGSIIHLGSPEQHELMERAHEVLEPAPNKSEETDNG